MTQWTVFTGLSNVLYFQWKTNMALHEFKNERWVMFTPDFSNVEESRRKKAMQISG